MKQKSNPFLNSILITGSAALLAGHAHSAPLVWSDTGNYSAGWTAWTTWTNGWNGNSTPYVNGSDVVFNGGGGSNVAVWETQNLNVGSMSFSEKDYFIGTTPGTEYTASLTLTNGNMDVASGTTTTFVNNAGSGRFALYGSNGITKTGGGTLFLNSPSDITGAIAVSAGTLRLAGGDWVTGNPWGGGGMTGAITVGNGATLSTSAGVTEIKNGLTLNGGTVSSLGNTYGTGNGSWGNLLLSSNISAGNAATSTISSELRLNDNRSIGVASDSTLNVTGGIAISPFGGTYGITKTGDGTLALSGNNTYNGSTTVSAGTLNFSGTNSIGTVNANGGSTIFSGGNTTINGNLNLNVEGISGLSFTGGVVTMNQLNFTVTGNPGEAFTISGTAEVRVNGGVTSQSWRGSSGMFLNGGTLITPWIASNSTTTPWLNDRGYIHFNGTKIVATQDEGNFIRLAGGANYGNENFANLDATTAFDTAGHNVGIGVELRGIGGLTKDGSGSLTLNSSSNYTGATTVSAGALLVNGALGNTAVSVGSSGTIGGSGSIAGSLNFGAGANLTVNLADPLAITGPVTFADFNFTDVVGWDYASAANGIYTLLAGSNIDLSSGVSNVGLGNALDLGGGRFAYFQEGSLQVVVIPEPRAAMLGLVGMLVLLRRRK
jgi:fibronectin-binding autotransporter adhesin